MALAIRWEGFLRDAVVKGPCRDRVLAPCVPPPSHPITPRAQSTSQPRTKIINLNLLAPNTQEEWLFFPRIEAGRNPFTLRNLQVGSLEKD